MQLNSLIPRTWLFCLLFFSIRGIYIMGAEPDFKAFVVSHTHSDFAWADSIAKCLDKNVAAVAKTVELAEKYPDFRFCMEHMLAVREYLRRNPEKLETLRQLMREGRFEAGGFYTGPWQVTAGSEALVRELYFGKLWVEKTLGVSPQTVWNVDVAGHTAQLPQILQKAGIKGYVISSGSEGPNIYRWQARDGSSVITWNTPWWYSAGATLGLRDTNLAKAITNFPRFVADVTKNADTYHLPKIGFIADGTDVQSPSGQVVENVRQWNSEKRFPPLTYSSTAAAFAAAENEPLPIVAGELPSPWDSVQSQGNECFMPDRRLDGKVLAAEKLAAFYSMVTPTYVYPKKELNEIWEKRLYVYDHNWGGWYGAENDQWKAEKIHEAGVVTDQMLREALKCLAGKINFKGSAKAGYPIVVFNPLSWERKDIVTCELPEVQLGMKDVSVFDSRGRSVPCQSKLLRAAPSSPHMPPTLQVTFCPEVPSMGYSTYYVVWGKKTEASPFRVDSARNIFENKFYRLTLDSTSGGIKSILNKKSNKELVRQNSKYACNELIALEDDDVDIGMHLTGKRWLGREHPSMVNIVENGPVRLVIEVTGYFLERSMRRQQIILYADLPRIDLLTSLDWEGKRNVHVYQEFPLNVSEPRVRYAIPYGWEEYGQEMKYAAPWFEKNTQNVAKHRWRGVRGWVELANANTAVTLASQCNYAAFKDVGPDPEDGFLIQPLLLRTIRSCGDGGKLFYEQKGTHEFRFALQAQADSARLGEELDSPMLCSVAENVKGTAAGLPERYSFVSVKPENVHVSVVKRAEDGQGLILRMVEMQERTRQTKAELKLFRPVGSATRTSILEENQAALSAKKQSVTVPMAPAGIETVRVKF